MRTVRARYKILLDMQYYLLLHDLGPWDEFMTITNAAEGVVKEVAHRLGKRRLFYYDSENKLTELVVRDGAFIAFKNV